MSWTRDLEADFMRKVGAIVLGGGRGTRLYPLTAMRAKPAVPLAGRYRLVDIPLSNCLHSEITRIVVLTQFNSHSLNRHINNAWHFDRFMGGFVEVLAAEQTETTNDWFQGTADAVRKQLLHIRNLKAKYYVILSGDQLYRMDYRELMATHIRKKADITVSALPVNRRDAQGFGIMRLSKTGRIRQFVEKPKDPVMLDTMITPDSVFADFGLKSEGRPYLASMGVYAFNAEVLESLLVERPEWIDFGREMIPGALRSHRVYCHPFTGFWEDIGTVRSYFEVSMALCRPNPPFEFHNEQHLIYTHARPLPGVRIQDAQIKDSIICEGSRITKATINNALVGVRSVVHPGAELNRTILLGAEHFEEEIEDTHRVHMGIGAGAKVSNAIIDHNARIGRNVVINGSERLKDYDGPGYTIRDGIVVILKNAIIPDNTVIG